MIRTAEKWIFEEMGIEMPKGQINREWFVKHPLPMIVQCACCQRTMALPSAMINDDGTIFCHSCADE